PVHTGPASGAVQAVLGDIALYVAVAMAIFAVLFGTRHIDATEHQHGLMLAIATESIVKLVAFVGVGIFVTFWMFDGPRLLFAQAMERPDTAAVLTRDPAPGTLLAMTLLSLFAIVLLPRQFHVTVVENNSEDEIRRASWLFPLYLVLINLFVVPIALAGLLTFTPGQVDSDMFVLALPLAAHSDLFTIAAFVGGLSAATAMVIVESVALAIMVSNDIVMPLVLQRREALISGRDNIGSLLLTVRRMAIFVILFLAYVYYRLAGDAQLASIGLLSFAAVSPLAPCLFRWTDLATGYRTRRVGGDDDRNPGLGLHAIVAELGGRRHRRSQPALPGPVGNRNAAPAGAHRTRFPTARPRRDLEPFAQCSCLCGVLAWTGTGLDRATAGRPLRSLRPDSN